MSARRVRHIPFADTCSYPPRDGNHVRPLVDGEPAFRRICAAIDAAERSVWVTVAFMHHDFAMPDGRGSLFDVLDRAAARGLDVRALFWRVNDDYPLEHNEVFPGDAQQRAMLGTRSTRWSARWDRAQKLYCQHQKSWIVDAGAPSEIAFVGGINLAPSSVVSPGHLGRDQGSTHDVYLEIRGPSASDVHHNFVQRWNEASDAKAADGCWPSVESSSDLAFPQVASKAAGASTVQVQRSVRAGYYRDGTAAPHAEPFAIAQGERSVFEQYGKALAAARSSIYLENQALGSVEIIDALHVALARGVEVVALVPADVNFFMREARKLPQSAPFFERLGALGDHERFALVGIAAPDNAGQLRNVYVHAKVALIDDCWATIGSCNLGARSFFGDTELNASFWDPVAVRALRCELLSEHIGEDTSSLDDRAAFARYRTLARENAGRRARGAALQGMCFDIDPKTYGA